MTSTRRRHVSRLRELPKRAWLDAGAERFGGDRCPRRRVRMFVAGSATWLIPRLGFFRAVLLGLALVAAMLAALPAVRGDSLWLGLRFVVGIGNSLLFTAGDTWINQIVENRVRGRWIGIYNTAGMAGWAAGPILGRRRAGGGWGEIPATGWRNLAALGAPGLRPMKQGPPKRPRALRSKPHGVLSAIERPSCPGSSRQQPPHLLDSPW